jgi:hypothetical protein
MRRRPSRRLIERYGICADCGHVICPYCDVCTIHAGRPDAYFCSECVRTFIVGGSLN